MNSPRIVVRNVQRRTAVDVGALQAFATAALPACLNAKSLTAGVLSDCAEVHVLIVSDRRMAQLHQKFLNVSGPTDVITFHHGEIFISADTAERQSAEFGTSTMRELQLYIVHGLLHLQGFDDTTNAASRQMRTVQERILRKLTTTTGADV